MRTSKKTQARRRSVKQLDADCRRKIFERDGKCVFCGSDRNLQWMHILSRRDIGLRWDSDNSVVGCAACHFTWHHQPLVGVAKFIELFPDRYERLLLKRRSGVKYTAKDLRTLAGEL